MEKNIGFMKGLIFRFVFYVIHELSSIIFVFGCESFVNYINVMN
jgi:hypothetical protein